MTNKTPDDLPVVTYNKPVLDAVGAAQQRASIVVIDDQTTYEIATDLARLFKSERDAWEAKRKRYADPINALKAEIQADFKPVIDDYDAAINVVKNRMAHYSNEQERKRVEAQAISDKLARDAAEAAEKEAAKAERKGDTERAEAIREIAAVSAPVTVAPTVTQVSGTSIRKSWKARVSNLQQLVGYIAANPQYLNLIEVDQSALNKLAAALEGGIQIPGVESYQDSVVALRK